MSHGQQEPEPPYSVRIQQDLIECMEALAMILPLAEAYLKGAPHDPDNAKLETARAVLHRLMHRSKRA